MQEIKLKFNSQVCTTKEQSQRLLDLGLKPETADMSLTVVCGAEIAQWVGELNNLGNIKVNGMDIPNVEVENIPAWSLHRLMEICAEYYLSLHLNIKNIMLYDHIIDIIENLIKLEKINKKYLQ